MFFINRFKFLIAVVAVVLGMTFAVSAKTTHLMLRLKDGRSIVLDLSSVGSGDNKRMPKMTFTPTSMKMELPAKESGEPGVVSAPQVYVFEVEDLRSLQPVETGTSGIDEIIASDDAVVISPVDGDMLRVTSGKAISAEDIKVYDMSGVSQAVDVVTESETSLIFSLARLQPGVYIVSVSSRTIKITKK